MPVYHHLTMPAMPGLKLPHFHHGHHDSRSHLSRSRSPSPPGTRVSAVAVEHAVKEGVKALTRKTRIDMGSRRSSAEILTAKASLKHLQTSQPAEIGMKIESPPLVCYGPPKDSTGALLSALLNLSVHDSELKFSSFNVMLKQEVVAKRPVGANCKDCVTTTNELKRWNFIVDAVSLDHGRHTYPISYLFPGSLPATNNNALSKINYYICGKAVTASGDEIKFNRPLTLYRSILPGPERHSIRIFPPTNLSATVTFPSVIHIGGEFKFDVRLDGIVQNDGHNRWQLRKTTWRIEEKTKVVSPACANHIKKLGATDEKGILHEHVRTVGIGEVKHGWKTDFDSADGNTMMEVMASIPPDSKAACQVEHAAGGITVAHTLVVEMIVAEEYLPRNGSRNITPTGAARVLRMQFNLVVTTRSGLGISWDEEAPPMYEDVPTPPPKYEGKKKTTERLSLVPGEVVDYNGPPIYEAVS